MLCCVLSNCVGLCCAVLSAIVTSCVFCCRIMLYSIEPNWTVRVRCVVSCRVVSCRVVLCCVVLCRVVLS